MIRMNRSLFAHLFCAAAAALGLHDYVHGEEVKESFLAEGVTAKMGGYRPIRAEMDQEAGIITKAPEGLTAPKYGYIEFGDKKWAFVHEEPAEGDAKLFIDSNGDGDVTNDPAAEWNAREQNGKDVQWHWQGSARCGQTGQHRDLPLRSKRRTRAALANTLLYYPDFGSEYTFKLDDKEFTTL